MMTPGEIEWTAERLAWAFLAVLGSAIIGGVAVYWWTS